MEPIGQQIQELIDARDDFVVLLTIDGIIVHSNQKWMDYCLEQRLPAALWQTGKNYRRCLEELEKTSALHSIDAVRSGLEKEAQLILSYTAEDTPSLSVTCRLFPLSGPSAGLILYQSRRNPAPNLNQLNTETVLENMTDAFFLLDRKMRFSFVNTETEKLLQRPKEDLLGRSIWACFPEAVGSRFYTSYTRAMRKRETVNFEEYYAPLDSWFRVKVRPVTDGGVAVYYQSVQKEDEISALLAEMPYKDFVTGLPTRRKFEESLESVLQADTAFSLFYINLDHFKHFNTFYSHDIGDSALKEIARSISRLVSPRGLAGRLEGDELVFVHFHQTQEEIEQQAERIKTVFTQPVVLENGLSVKVSASIGVASCPKDSRRAEELISFAETAMQAAKNQRGTACSFFTPGMELSVARRLLIEKSLAGDLSAQGFHFAVQPQMHCETGELTGMEVLARWNHPVLGPLSPVEFIAIAEEAGTISRLTNCLLEKVFAFVQTIQQPGGRAPKTAINVTPSLLASKRFFNDFFALMEKYRILPEWIELEITESVELTGSDITLNNLLAFRARGLSIALDDFGTGFSMLAYLMDYPIDQIKLDKAFVSKIGHDRKSEALLTSLIQFVRGIDCGLLAEGVETEAEAAFLQANGCFLHQGYLYDKPLLPDAFIEKYLPPAGALPFLKES